jgi:hypothetical protein
MSEITAVGVFEDRQKALSAVEALRRAGVPDDAVGLISRDEGKVCKPSQQSVSDPRTRDGLTAAAVGGASAGRPPAWRRAWPWPRG